MNNTFGKYATVNVLYSNPKVADLGSISCARFWICPSQEKQNFRKRNQDKQHKEPQLVSDAYVWNRDSDSLLAGEQ